MSDEIVKRLRAYPDDPTVVMSRAFVEEIAAHVERVEAELAAEREQVETLKYTVIELEMDKRELRKAMEETE